MRERLQRFFYGRYGSDQMNFALLILALVLSILGAIFFRPLCWVSDVLLLYALFRALSRNIPARQRENQQFWKIWLPVKNRLALQKRKWQERKQYKYFRCPSCKQQLRAPRGRGKIEVTCQSCHQVFQTKT